MTTYPRAGFKWNINEILSLQREFELLGWDIKEIATKHKRTPEAIMYKLDQEGFADYNVLYSNYYDLNSPIPVTRKCQTNLNFHVLSDEEEYNDEESECDENHDNVSNLTQRIEGLEDNIVEIKNMIQQMMSSLSNKKSKFVGAFA